MQPWWAWTLQIWIIPNCSHLFMFVLYVHMWLLIFFLLWWIYYCLIDVLLSNDVHFYRYMKGCTQTQQTCSPLSSAPSRPISSPALKNTSGLVTPTLFLSNTLHPRLAAWGSRLHHWIKNKEGTCEYFDLTILNLFLRIAWYKLPIANKIWFVRCKLAIVRGKKVRKVTKFKLSFFHICTCYSTKHTTGFVLINLM